MGHPAHFARREDPSLCRRGHEAPRSSPFQQTATRLGRQPQLGPPAIGSTAQTPRGRFEGMARGWLTARLTRAAADNVP